MKRLSILVACLLGACSAEKPEFVYWHEYAIPSGYVLGDIGASGWYSMGAEESDDIAIELESDAIAGGEVNWKSALSRMLQQHTELQELEGFHCCP